MAINLEIVTPLGPVVSQQVDHVVLPGKLGEFTVLDGHIPLLGAIKPGVVRFAAEGKTESMAIGSGFAEVGAADKVLVLTDDHARVEAIDVEAVRKELLDAEEALKTWSGEVEALDTETDEWKELPEYRALQEKVAWARARLSLVG